MGTEEVAHHGHRQSRPESTHSAQQSSRPIFNKRLSESPHRTPQLQYAGFGDISTSETKKPPELEATHEPSLGRFIFRIPSSTRAPNREDSAHLFTSDMPLSTFHRNRYHFHFPIETEGEKPGNYKEYPKDHLFPLDFAEWLATDRMERGIAAVKCTRKVHGFEGMLAVKISTWTKQEEISKVSNETATLFNSDLRHNHIIAPVGCYRKHNQIGLVLFPVAAYDLGRFMRKASEHNASRLKDSQIGRHVHIVSLRRYFTCLCKTVQYLHERPQPIKHRDIKPANILVDRFYNVILADFGESRIYKSREAASTATYVDTSRRFAPRQVSESETRTLEWDTFSLGCVFVEMATVIMGETLENLWERCRKDEPKTWRYHDRLREVREWIEHLKTRRDAIVDPLEALDDSILNIIFLMISDNEVQRPKWDRLISEFEKMSPRCKECRQTHHSSGHSMASSQKRKSKGSSSTNSTRQTGEPQSPATPTSPGDMVLDPLVTVHENQTIDLATASPSSPWSTRPPSLASRRSSGIRITVQRNLNSISTTQATIDQDVQTSMAKANGAPKANSFPKNVEVKPPDLETHIPSASDKSTKPMSSQRDSTRGITLASPPNAKRLSSQRSITIDEPELSAERNISGRDSIYQVGSKQSPRPNPNIPLRYWKPPSEMRWLHSMRNVPGTQIVVYDETKENPYEIRPKEEVLSELINGKRKGIIMRLPRGDGLSHRLNNETGIVNLWKCLPFQANLKRIITGSIRRIVLIGEYPQDSLPSYEM